MKIAIIGWGSLICDPGILQFDGEWREDGPILPIEFSRISQDGRLTLIVDKTHGVPLKTKYTLSQHTLLDQAIDNLAKREKCPVKHIGFVHGSHTSYTTYPHHEDVFEEIKNWSQTLKIDAAIWTALPATFEQVFGKPFMLEHAAQYFKGLDSSTQDRAKKYLEKAPKLVQTPLRREFKKRGFIS